MKKTDVTTRAKWLAVLVTGVAIRFFLSADSARHLDYFFTDYFSRHQSVLLTPDPDIVVIDIDDYSLTEMMPIAGRWVWPRAIHAELVEGLAAHAVKAIVFDIIFSEADIYRPDSDAYFNEVLAEQAQVYFAVMELEAKNANQGPLLASMPEELGLVKTALADANARGHFLVPDAIAIEHWQVGTINFISDSDGIGRRYDVWRNIDGWQIPSLAQKVIAGISDAPLSDKQQMILQWRGDGIHSFTRYSYADVYQAVMQQNLSLLQNLAGKIIVIGSTASGLFDLRATPISTQYPAVYMLAMAIDNLKNQRDLTELPSSITYAASLISVFVIGLIFLFVKKFNWQLIVAGIGVMTLCIGLIVASYQLLLARQILYIGGAIAVVISAYLAFALLSGIREYLARKQAIAMFGRFLDPTIVTQLVEQGKLDLTNTNQYAAITVLFSDIRNFTSLSEHKNADEIVALLNQYFDRQVATIFANHGTLDKFIGDCIMAFWGAPVANEYQQRDAINTALAMEQQLLALKAQQPDFEQSFDIGIGIHSGDAVVGMIGASQRVDYTAIGDTVNLASRIEGLTKNTARILVSEQTMLACKDDFDFSYQGEFEVKGRAQAVKLYQPKRKQ